MVKVWKDLSEMKATQLPRELEGIREIMQDVPNFNKNEGARKVYQRKEYTIYRVSNGFIIHNTKEEFKKAHTHVKSFEMAKVLIDCCIRKKMPRTRNHYLLQSIIRISIDKKYIEEVQSLIDVRESKSLNKYVIKR